MKKLTYAELKTKFWDFNCEHEIKTKGTGKYITGVIVFKESNWTTPYSLESRSYRVTSDNKAFIPGQGGYSIFAGSLDGTDPCVRLEQFMREECGGKDGWEVDYCYLCEECE